MGMWTKAGCVDGTSSTRNLRASLHSLVAAGTESRPVSIGQSVTAVDVNEKNTRALEHASYSPDPSETNDTQPVQARPFLSAYPTMCYILVREFSSIGGGGGNYIGDGFGNNARAHATPVHHGTPLCPLIRIGRSAPPSIPRPRRRGGCRVYDML